MDNQQWHHYAASASGFLGEALHAQRGKAFLFQEQQRTLIGIQDEQYNTLWLRLQAMPLPRPDRFTEDLERIVTKVQLELGIVATIDLERLGELIHAGLE